MRVRFTIDYRRDLIHLWYHRVIMGEHHISFRLPFTGQGIVPGKKRRNKNAR